MPYNEIRELIDRVRRRWRAQRLFEATVRGALSAAAALGRAWWPLRRAPGDIQVARFIEERAPSLEDRLVSAVDVSNPAHAASTVFADLMLADAARRAREVDLDTILPGIVVRRAGFQAAASALVFLAVLWTARGPVRQTFDSASLALFPERVALEVTPGHARIKAGTALAIRARL